MRRLLALVAVLLAPSLHADRIVHTEKSLYRNITVVDKDEIRCLTFNVKRRKSRQTCVDLEDRDRLVLPYAPLTFAGLAIKPDPERVLILGLGGGTLADVFAALFPGIEIDAVEIDPAVVKMAREYFDFVEQPGTSVYLRDARVFVRRALRNGERYDYIVLDAFNGDYIPEHLMTREFLSECRELLADDGVLVANTFSSSRLYDSESVTYEAALGEFLNLRQRAGNRIIVAAASGVLPDAPGLERNIAAIDADLDRFGIDLVEVLALDSGRDWRRKARVLTDEYSPANLLQGR